ncbi:hypothetical protein [Noviherbaspirillum galbum]|uniref:Uncharacterized protein n=1 Tax=Noviherbaspirillum galbum TaxID=2709383 RepID=A0A6B3SUB2_9BURK|nr:hypothetical protein [Noviherbaspirillum galbum]NEX64600.1 hypothetical protein [Noviherbaspirillum galbum]
MNQDRAGGAKRHGVLRGLVPMLACVVVACGTTACSGLHETFIANKPYTTTAAVEGDYVAPGQEDTIPACIRAIPAQERSAKRFLRLSIFSLRNRKFKFAEVPADSPLQHGDIVRIEAHDCSAGELSVIQGRL